MAKDLVAGAYKLASIWKALVNAVRDAASKVGMAQAEADTALDALEDSESAPLLARLAALILGKEPPAQVVWPCQVHAADLIPEGSTVLEDVAPSDFKVEALEFLPFLEGKEKSVGGRVMRGRAVIAEANFGLSDGKRMLAEQTKIPAELRGKYIVLTGTLMRHADGYLFVAFLHWFGDRWVLFFYCLGRDFSGSARLPRRK